MKRILTIISILFFSTAIFAQEVYLNQYSSFCESDIVVEDKYIQERINSIYKSENSWKVELTVINDCNVKLYPTLRIYQDTLFIETQVIERQINILENGDTIFEISIPEECYCAYLVKLDLSIDTISNLKVNNKNLPITTELFRTFPIRYFIYKGDTTGFDDSYGLRQGCFVIEKKNGNIMKQFYKDNKLVKCELYDKVGVLLDSDNDCFEKFNGKEK